MAFGGIFGVECQGDIGGIVPEEISRGIYGAECPWKMSGICTGGEISGRIVRGKIFMGDSGVNVLWECLGVSARNFLGRGIRLGENVWGPSLTHIHTDSFSPVILLAQPAELKQAAGRDANWGGECPECLDPHSGLYERLSFVPHRLTHRRADRYTDRQL